MTTPLPKVPFSTLPFVLAALAGAIGIYWFESDGRKGGDIFAPVTQQNVANSGFSKALAKGPMAAFLVHGTRKAVPVFTFTNDKGETLDIGQWKGKVGPPGALPAARKCRILPPFRGTSAAQSSTWWR
jgi:hypothetical protein